MALTVVPKNGAVVDDIDHEKVLAKWLNDFFVQSFAPQVSGWTDLNVNMNLSGTGIAVIWGHEVEESANNVAVAVPASVTSSIWIQLVRTSGKVTSVQYLVQVATPSDALKICDFVSGASTITSVTDQRGTLSARTFAPTNVERTTNKDIASGYAGLDGATLLKMVEAPEQMKLMIYQWNNSAAATVGPSTTAFHSLSGYSKSATETLVYQSASRAGTFKNLTVVISVNGITANSSIFFRRNSVDGAIGITVPASTTGLFRNTTNTDAVILNDGCNTVIVTGGTGTTLTWRNSTIEEVLT